MYPYYMCTPQLCLHWFDLAPRLPSFVKMYAMATLAPRLEWPRDKQIAPPRSSKLLTSSFLDDLLEIMRT